MMWLSDFKTLEPGDIAFYKGDPTNPIDSLVMLRTGSEMVHVAVFRDADDTISATSEGIVRRSHRNEYKVWRPVAGYLLGRLQEGLAYLDSEIGQAYGYADIANQVLLLTGKDPVLLDKSHDCSDLATKFLWCAGVALPYALLDTNRVTPGGLATALDRIA